MAPSTSATSILAKVLSTIVLIYSAFSGFASGSNSPIQTNNKRNHAQTPMSINWSLFYGDGACTGKGVPLFQTKRFMCLNKGFLIFQLNVLEVWGKDGHCWTTDCQSGTFQLGNIEPWQLPQVGYELWRASSSSGNREGGSWADRTAGMHSKNTVDIGD